MGLRHHVTAILFSTVLLALVVQHTLAIRWIGLHGTTNLNWTSSNDCRRARMEYGLSKGQTKICKGWTEIMPHVTKAAYLAVNTCTTLFQDRRWNCSTLFLTPKLTPDLITGTREQGIVYAISSAAITYQLARGCADGSIFHCSCAIPSRKATAKAVKNSFQWGGCGDNVRWGAQFTRSFTDILENERDIQTQRNLRLIDATVFDEKNNRNYLLNVMNLHNNKAGRKAVSQSLQMHCKCHGVSGTCNIRTCWKSLPSKFIEVGKKLVNEYSRAIEIKAGVRTGSLRYSSTNDLVYVTKSPDYCNADPKLGSYGTSGRACNKSLTGYAGCESMCCGRGYSTKLIEKIERCQCKYHWCCYVKCKICHTWIERQYCN